MIVKALSFLNKGFQQGLNNLKLFLPVINSTTVGIILLIAYVSEINDKTISTKFT